jgi:uncharacterized protein YcgI (DUF1989 family)
VGRVPATTGEIVGGIGVASLQLEMLVPKCEGRSWPVKAGQEVRIVAVEGPQAADVIAWSAADPREGMSSWLTRHMSGNFGRASKVYSKLPAGRQMFTVLTDRPGLLWLSPGRCNRLKYALLGDPDHANCQDILAATIAPYGMSAFDVPEVLNVFMNPQLHTDGSYHFEPSPVEPGDYFGMRAEMDVVMAVSACPDDAPYNAGRPKPLRIEVWE